MDTKYGKLISRDRNGNLTAVYPEIACDHEIDFQNKRAVNPVSNYVIAEALEGLKNDIKNAFSSANSGLGWNEGSQSGYVDLANLSEDDILSLINKMLKNGGSIILDNNGKLAVDFSKLTADQVLSLFLTNGGIVKDSSSGKLKVDFSKLTADQLLQLFVSNSGIVKDSSSGKLDVDFSKAPTYTGATSSKAGTPGYVPAAGVSEKDKFLKGDGTWSDGGFAHLAGAETFTGSKTFGAGLFGNTTAISASAINLALGTVFTKTITASTTFTISGVPSGTAATFNLILTNGGSKVITWPSNVKWTDGTPPELTASGVDVLTFLTPNGGTTWYGCLALNGAA